MSAQFEHIDVPHLLKLLFIEAEKRGKAWTAKCPSGKHDDKNASWSIREEPGSRKNGKHNCFSCKYGGTAIDLVMHVLDLSPQGANDFIEEKALLEVHPTLAVKIELQSGFHRPACTLPPGVHFDADLDNWVTQARRYVEKRKITPEQVKKWGLGYSVDGRLAGRLIVPTRARDGRLLAWTARTYLDAPKRYLAASTEDCPERDAVFGEQHWSPTLYPSLVITEGAFNALAVERVLPPDVYVGALSGSHIEPGHALKLSRFRRVIILTDPDHAGDDAADKLMAMLGRHAYVYRLRLADKEDPDSVDPAYLRESLCQALRILNSSSAP